MNAQIALVGMIENYRILAEMLVARIDYLGYMIADEINAEKRRQYRHRQIILGQERYEVLRDIRDMENFLAEKSNFLR